ncbi:glycosyltransferase family 4 protein [Aquabacterium sp.]|uniref:glycosyltransferase family 4 protein n=1 Tax=Aquabacterium sp. TaxID=1872578 RepID=UPI003784ADCB
MKVLFDVFELDRGHGNSLGIFRYAQELFQGLQAHASPEFELVLAGHGGNAADFPVTTPHARVLQVADHYPRHAQRLRWRVLGARQAMARSGAQLYFSPKGFLPWLGARRSVIVVHDLIPLWYAEAHPQHFRGPQRWLVNHGLRTACRRADELITISAASAVDIARRTGRTRHVHVIHNGLAPVAEPAVASEAPRGDYLFSVGSALPHKNLAGVLAAYRAYRQLSERPLPLVICGAPDTGEPFVTSVRGLGEQALQAHYRGAAAFVFLSRAEGFGFPPLEAMQHGVPVVCSDIPALREVTQGKALLVNPDDSRQAAEALLRATTPGEARERLREEGQVTAAQYRWEHCARQVFDVLRATALR